MLKPLITIVDYTLGNLFNLKKAFQLLGCEVSITASANEIENAEKLVLPGVGNFAVGMKFLSKMGLDEAIIKYTKSDRYLLGICLGMQMLMSNSEEAEGCDGLQLIKGQVKRFRAADENSNFKIPHYGLSKVAINERNSNLLNYISENSYFYFIHSYFVHPKSTKHSIGITKYGNDTFTSIVNKGSIYGCQFHPELSGLIGLKLLDNFVKLK